jgi:hypothetical protein
MIYARIYLIRSSQLEKFLKNNLKILDNTYSEELKNIT